MHRLRCRLGLHAWVRVRHADPDLENPGADVEWRTVCRYCGCEERSGTALSLVLVAAALVGSALSFWLLSPFLGAVLMVAAVAGLMWSMAPGAIGFVVRWLSSGR